VYPELGPQRDYSFAGMKEEMLSQTPLGATRELCM